MHFKLKRGVTAIAIVATAAFAGGAYAATQSSPTSPGQAFLNDAAKRLKVTPQQLHEAFRGAFFDQLDAAVAAGKLTKAQAEKIKQRAQTEGGPGSFLGVPGMHLRGAEHGFALPGLRFGRPAGGPWHGGRVSAAATYLGLTRQQLFDQLTGGKSLAQIANSRGKSVSGLKAAMLAVIRARLSKAVSANLITAAREQQILSRLPARLDAEINHAGLRAPRGDFLFHRPDGRPGMGPGGPGGAHGGVPPMPPPGPAGLAAAPPGAPSPPY